jgi:histidinol-phosphatase (PHP family)
MEFGDFLEAQGKFSVPSLLSRLTIRMPQPIPHDYHMHSNFSEDGHASIREMCLAAVERQIPEIGFSEHLDQHPNDVVSINFYHPDDWWKEIRNARTEFAGRLVVRAGLEAGESHRYPAKVQALERDYPYDYIIGSLHYDGDHFLFDPEYLQQTSPNEILHSYFSEVEQMTRQPLFDILGHLDLPARNARRIWEAYDPVDHEDLIRGILRNCIAHGLALDVNVAGMRKPSQNIMPHPTILRWFHEMGGERITLGSDAHSDVQVGLHLDLAVKAVRAAGLEFVTCFERRRPRLVPLED